MKTVLLICSFVFMAGAWPLTTVKKYTYIALLFIFFPIYLPFMGRDAITTGTICIFLLYLKYLWETKKLFKEKYDYWIYLLILISAISVILPFLSGEMSGALFGSAVRQFFQFTGAMLLFMVIKNYENNSLPHSEMDVIHHIEKLFTFILIFVSIHILISGLVKFLPPIGQLFTPFLPRDMNALDIAGRGELERIESFVFGYEQYGEILAVLAPVVLFRLYKYNPVVWLLVYLWFCFGMLLTSTRSGLLLLLFGTLISVFYFSKGNFGKTYTLTFIGASLFFLILFFFPSSVSDIIYRFKLSANTYASGGNLIQVINRDDVFIPAWELTMEKLSFFGNGLTEFNYHNLPLTILHQLGIIGAILFLAILVYPMFLLFKSYKEKSNLGKRILFACLLSMVLFLINETKFEFNRDSSYQQLCWALFGTYYLVCKALSRWKQENREYIYEHATKGCAQESPC